LYRILQGLEQVDQQELHQRFKDIALKLQAATSSDPLLSALITTMMTLFETQNGQLALQNEQLTNLNKKLEENQITIEKLMALIDTLNMRLGNRTLTTKKLSDENINGKKSEKKKGIDSSSKEKKPKASKKSTSTSDVIKVEERQRCVDVDGTTLTLEEAKKKLGTIFTGKDGRRYKYVRINDSSDKVGIELTVIRTHYTKLQVVAVDENGNELSDIKVPVTVYPETDYLKKSSMSISLMSLILEQWLNLKAPLNRISQYLSRHGIEYTRQQLYSYTDTTAAMLMPVFKYMERYIAEAKLIGVDETYWSCREKQKLKDDSSVEDDNSKRKSQRSKSKTCRSYVFGIITPKVCLYYHSLERNSDIPKTILLDNEVSKDCFVESDAFYRKMFSIKIEIDGKEVRLFCHGICWIHARRNFCELINYATHKDGTPITDMVKNNWEQDIEDSKELIEAITKCFNVYNEQVRKCISNSKLDIVKLKNKHVKPLIDAIFDKAKAIFKDIERVRANKSTKEQPEPKRKCSDRLYKAIVYLVKNEDRLRAFLDSPYGVMQNNNVEEKFRELDILRNGMIASDTCKGAENLTLFYSLYKTCILHNTDFRTYMKKVIETMTLHMNEIEFEKDKRGTITGYKSHKISSDVLESLMPWNMA